LEVDLTGSQKVFKPNLSPILTAFKPILTRLRRDFQEVEEYEEEFGKRGDKKAGKPKKAKGMHDYLMSQEKRAWSDSRFQKEYDRLELEVNPNPAAL